MALTLDSIVLGVPQVTAAHAFYSSAFSALPADHADSLDLRGTGHLSFRPVDTLAAAVDTNPATSGFRGYVLSSIVTGPTEVKALLDTATAAGATTVKPAKKQLFGEFTAVYQAPDGAVWKLAASSKKDPAPLPDPPEPTETAIYLGVVSPKTSRSFYEGMGMTVDRDYGDKFIDFTITDGVCRLGLLTRKSLAKDTGVDERGDGFAAVVLTHTADSRDEVDALLAAARAGGGRVRAAAEANGHYRGYFADPDGFHWKVTADR